MGKDLECVEDLFKKSQLFFSALGDPVRQNLLASMLGSEHLSVKELTSRTNLSRPTISHHLKILKEANIITEEKRGREIFYRPQPGENYQAVKQIITIIDEIIETEGRS